MAVRERVSLEMGCFRRFSGSCKFRDYSRLILSALKRSEKTRLHGGILKQKMFHILLLAHFVRVRYLIVPVDGRRRNVSKKILQIFLG